ncbi:MAG TPA: Coenzyme F420 hydrogenase/dehydrogenase, beta subunit C-terminal domain [Actinotalea sp.]
MGPAPAREAHGLDREIARVVQAGNCSGCGACCQLDAGLTMALDTEGFARPVRTGEDPAPDAADRLAVDRFRSTCPGVSVQAARVAGAARHPMMGPALGAWRAWAADETVRHAGSSGGVLTALAGWLSERDDVAQVVGAAADPADPRRTVSVQIRDRAEALAASGSRYGPVGNAAAAGALDPAGAFVGKPCEASALRGLARATGQDAPLILSFFCAGTPSQRATDDLVEELGVPRGAALAGLRYRGNGWPGRFVARTVEGSEVSASYEESWGDHLGRAVQWRCKICPDGVGESSDISAGDLWRTDDRGYPGFEEGAGVSALLARTPRGLRVVEEAIAAGVIVAELLDLDEIAAVQPLQRKRRQTLLGRLVGARLAGRRPPRYRGFGLVRLALARPRETLRTARGTFSRVRSDGGRPTSPSRSGAVEGRRS